MKKIFLTFIACLLVNNICAMAYARRIAGVTEEEVAAAMERRKNLTYDQQAKLGSDLWYSLESVCQNSDTCVKVKRLLENGVDPSGDRHYPPVLQAASMDQKELVALLLAYGANPDGNAAIAWATDFECIKLLVRAGADINAVRAYFNIETVLTHLCAVDSARLITLVWVLMHGANPNIGPAYSSQGFNYTFAIHNALLYQDLPKVIALLQYGARFDVKTSICEPPLDFAKSILCPHQRPPKIFARAQYEFLIAINDHKLDPHIIYTISEYEAVGISHESAVLIQKATQEVNEAFVQCRLDDWQFEHPGQSLSKFILTRELGKAGNRRK